MDSEINKTALTSQDLRDLLALLAASQITGAQAKRIVELESKLIQMLNALPGTS